MNDRLRTTERHALTYDQLCDLSTQVTRVLPHAFFVLSLPDYTFSFLNPTAESMFAKISGLDRDELLGARAADVMPGWDQSLCRIYEQAAEDGRPVELSRFEVTVRGERKYWDLFLLPTRGAQGEITEIASLLVDVTSHVGTGRTQELEFWTAFRESPIGMAVTHMDGRITNVNEASQNMLQRDIEELRSTNLHSYIHSDDLEAYEYCLSVLQAAHSDRCEFEVRMCSRDAAEVCVDAVASVVRGVWGKPRYIVATMQDVTARRTAERELAEAKNLMEHHLHLLQRALVPTAPLAIPGYQIAHAYVPAFAGEEIGGDFYDVFYTDEGKVGILIGDVSGKGIGAASLAATTRSTVRAFAFDSLSPSDTISHANRLLHSLELQWGEFVTACIVILDPESGEIRYSSAGHPPLVICRADDSMVLLEQHGSPLAITDDLRYSEAACRLGVGDKLILYTDGIIDARNADQGLFGVEGVVNTMRSGGCGSSAEVIDRLLSAAQEWSEERLTDDIAILVVERRG